MRRELTDKKHLKWRHSPLPTYLLISQVVLEPVPEVSGWQRVACIHEPQAADVRGVAVVQHASQLLPRQLQGEQLVEETEGRGDNPT